MTLKQYIRTYKGKEVTKNVNKWNGTRKSQIYGKIIEEQ